MSNTYEEILEEERITDENNNNKTKIIKRVVKLNKPVFEIAGGVNADNWKDKSKQPPIINEKEIFEGLHNEKSKIDKFLDNGEKGIYIYRAPEIEVKEI